MISISFVIPLYNKESYLSRCLESVLNYRDLPIEVIIVDDCSEDGSLSIANEYSTRDERVRVVSHAQNKGTYAARETGVMSARGEYIFFLDPDDWIESRFLNEAIPYMGEMDMIGFNMVFLFKNNETSFWGARDDCFLMGRDILEEYTSMRMEDWSVSPKLVKTSVVKEALEALQIKERFIVTEDLLLFFSMCLFSKTYQRIGKTIYIYFFADDLSLTRTPPSKESLLEHIRQTNDVLNILGDLLEAHDHPRKMALVRRALVSYFNRKIDLAKFNPLEKHEVVEELMKMFDAEIVYELLRSSLLNGYSSGWQEKWMWIGNALVKVINSQFPVGSFRRALLKKALRKVYQFLKTLREPLKSWL